eukprot:scaffold2523_cov193-Skeletonema_menzelii.AAC.9
MSPTAWRSPLSILIGAHRNDDSDLELRQGSTPPPNNITPAAAGRRRKSNQPSSAGGLTAYIPFSYFGLNSPAPALQNNIDMEDTPSAHPPLRAFPPPISNSEGDRSNNYIVDHGKSNQQYTSSHPWYNKLALPDSNDQNYTGENDLSEQKEDDIEFLAYHYHDHVGYQYHHGHGRLGYSPRSLLRKWKSRIRRRRLPPNFRTSLLPGYNRFDFSDISELTFKMTNSPTPNSRKSFHFQ